MRKTAFVVFIGLAVLGAADCRDNLTGPSPLSGPPTHSGLQRSTTTLGAQSFMGTWQATKAEGSSDLKPGVRRDLVAEGGTVTLILERTSQALGLAVPDGKYTITVAMPGTNPGIDTGFWHYTEFHGHPQIDFYPASLGTDPEYGWIPAFLVALSDNNSTLKLWDSGLTFLPFDFGWGTTPGMNGTMLDLVFTRQ